MSVFLLHSPRWLSRGMLCTTSGGYTAFYISSNDSQRNSSNRLLRVGVFQRFLCGFRRFSQFVVVIDNAVKVTS